MIEINFNGEIYVKKQDPSKIKMVRTYSAGVFYGEIVSQKIEAGVMVVEMANARRVWYWAGAASLSQLATDGTSKPEECKFPCKVAAVTLVNVIEILDVTDKALTSLNKVAIWQK